MKTTLIPVICGFALLTSFAGPAPGLAQPATLPEAQAVPTPPGKGPHPPLYLGGIVSTLLWGAPHARMALQLDPDMNKPADLAEHVVPRRGQDQEMAKALAQAAINVGGDRQWGVYMVPMTTLASLNVPVPEVGDRIGVVGSPSGRVADDPSVQVHLLVIKGVAYPVDVGAPPAPLTSPASP